MKETYDQHRQGAREYKEGDQVWLEGTNLKSLRPSVALNERRYGPFKILEKIGASAYRLAISETWSVHDVFNEALLTPYVPPAFTNQQLPPPPPPDVIDGEEEHEVEAIINSKVVGQGREKSMMYLVKWKGYPDSETGWEPAANLENAQEEVEKYWKAHPRRKRYGY